MEYKISVIIPVYNQEKYIEECLNSLINQTIGFSNIQVILVNDGSTDNSKDLIDKFVKVHDNAVGIHLDKSHFIGGFARNEGIKYAKGKYLMFLDSDDCFAPKACEQMYNLATEKGADIVTANYRCMFQDGTLWTKSTFDKEKYKTCELVGANETFFYLYCPSACMKIFDTDLIVKNNIQFLDGVPAEDAYFTTIALLKSKKVYYMQDDIYYYRRVNTGYVSTSWMRNKRYFMGVNFAFSKIYKAFEEAGKIDCYRYYYAKNFISIIYKFIDSKLITNDDRKELISEMYWFFEQSKLLNIKFPQESIRILVQYILNKEYEIVNNICIILSEARNFMAEHEKEMMAKPQKIIMEE